MNLVHISGEKWIWILVRKNKKAQFAASWLWLFRGNAEQPPIVDAGNNSPTSHQVAQHETADAGNPNATRVSVLSPQKQQYLSDNPEDGLGALDKRPSSNCSSRFSRRRLELEVEIAADEASAEIESKQQEFELRRKQREMELGLATQKEAMELAELKRQELSVKMKKWKS